MDRGGKCIKKIIVLARNWYESVAEPFELMKDNFGSLVAYEVLCRLLRIQFRLFRCV